MRLFRSLLIGLLLAAPSCALAVADISLNFTCGLPCSDFAASTTVLSNIGTGNGTLAGGDNTNTAGKSVAGPGGSNSLALALNGSDDSITLGDALNRTNGQSGTISVYIKFDQASGVIGDTDVTTNRGIIKVDDTTIRVATDGGSADFTVTSIGTSAFRLITVTRETTTNSVRVYLDGVESSSGPQALTGVWRVAQVGRNFDGTSFLDGAVSDIRVYVRQLTVEDMQAIIAYSTAYSGTISFVNQSSADATGTTTATPNYPASPAAGDWFSYFIANKYPTNAPGAMTGFTQLAQVIGGAGGSPAADSGEVYATLFSKDTVSGSESGNAPATTVTSGDSILCKLHAFRRTTGGTTWGIATATGGDATIGNAYSVTFGSDPGIQAGDCVLVYTAVNGGGTTHNFSSPALTVPGCTIISTSELTDAGTNSGQDCGYRVHRFQVSAGTSSGVAIYNAREAFGGNAMGGSVLVRLREVSASTPLLKKLLLSRADSRDPLSIIHDSDYALAP